MRNSGKQGENEMRYGISRAILLVVLFAVTTCATAAEPAPQPDVDPYYGGELTIRVVDSEGRPIEGAIAGFTGIRVTDGTWHAACNVDAELTDADGLVQLPKGRNLLDEEGRTLVAWHEDKKLIGIIPVALAKPDAQGVATIPVASGCSVTGVLTCEELTKLGQSIGWAIVYVHRGDLRPLGYASEEQKFEFWLPPGEYELEAYGTKLHDVRRKIQIDPGQAALAIPAIDLPAVRSALLEGQPAPELREVAGWKNSEPLTLHDLRGKYVLLNFWGHWCGPCVSHMPRLFEAYERYSRDELEIIGVHVGGKDESVESAEQLDKLLAEIRTEYWTGRDVPFPVALCSSTETPHHGTTSPARSVAAADYGVVGYPTTILIDREGRVIGVSEVDAALHADGWEKMDRLLGR
jgi:thiol-disulfide isomerase/thioredoxin